MKHRSNTLSSSTASLCLFVTAKQSLLTSFIRFFAAARSLWKHTAQINSLPTDVIDVPPMIQAASADSESMLKESPLFDSSFVLAQLAYRGIRRSINDQSQTSDWTWLLNTYFAEWKRLELMAHPAFDNGFYVDSNPDLNFDVIEPLTHYLTKGWLEGRNPHAMFDGNYYLKHSPDVARAGLNPLVHYVHDGSTRKFSPLFDINQYHYFRRQERLLEYMRSARKNKRTWCRMRFCDLVTSRPKVFDDEKSLLDFVNPLVKHNTFPWRNFETLFEVKRMNLRSANYENVIRIRPLELAAVTPNRAYLASCLTPKENTEFSP